MRKLFIPYPGRIIHFTVWTKVKAEEIEEKLWTDQRDFSSKAWQNMPVDCLWEDKGGGESGVTSVSAWATGGFRDHLPTWERSSEQFFSFFAFTSKFLCIYKDNLLIHFKFSHVAFCPTPPPSSVPFLQDRNMYHPLYSQLTQVFLRWNKCFLSTVNK